MSSIFEELFHDLQQDSVTVENFHRKCQDFRKIEIHRVPEMNRELKIARDFIIRLLLPVLESRLARVRKLMMVFENLFSRRSILACF